MDALNERAAAMVDRARRSADETKRSRDAALRARLLPKIAAVQDAIGPSSPNNEQLNDSEFGEAGINLTAAGIFPAGTCNSFGKVFGVSRSSGNSGTAQMKDLAGPGDFNLTNCGTVTVIKHTDPAGLSQAFPFTSTLAGAQLSCTVTSAAGAEPCRRCAGHR